jgi:hypothetical protein
MPHARVVAVPALCLALLVACGGDDAVNTGAGSLHVRVNPPVSQFDPDGFDVRVDNGSPRDVPAEGELAIEGMSPGPHTVELTDVELPCQVTTDNPRTVTVVADEVVTATFTVVCETTGFIAVTTHTTGDDPDPDGYALAVDGADAPLIGANATVTLATDAGVHGVTLSEIADNCAVQGGSATQTVTVTAGETVDLTFDVACTAVP